MNIIQNDHGGMTYVSSGAHTGTDQRCDLLASTRMLIDTHSDLCAAVRRHFGDDASIPNDLLVRLNFGRYVMERMRGGELGHLARICNSSR